MDALKEAIQRKYGEAARQARRGAKAACGCGESCEPDPMTSNRYDETQAAGVPAEALLASLGCGNPTALADAKQFLDEAGLSDGAPLAQVDGRIMSAFIRATKPAAATRSCCGPTCCY